MGPYVILYNQKALLILVTAFSYKLKYDEINSVILN